MTAPWCGICGMPGGWHQEGCVALASERTSRCDAVRYWVGRNMGGARYCHEIGVHSLHRDKDGETWR